MFINDLLNKVVSGLDGIKDYNIIMSDTIYRVANKNYIMADLSEKYAKKFNYISEDKDKKLSHFRTPYLTGFYSGFFVNLALRFTASSMFDDSVAKVVSFFSPEIAAGITRLAKTIGEEFYISRNYKLRE